MRKYVTLLVCCFVCIGAFAGSAHAATTTYSLSSTNVRLDVDKTYAYRLVEKSTGKVLLSQNQTIINVGGATTTSTTIANIATTTNSLSGDVTLTGTKGSVVVHVKFTFNVADTLHVDIWRDSTLAQPIRIGERYVDSGQHYYGVWEVAYGNDIDNKGITGSFSGNDNKVNGVFASSARAPFFLSSNNVGVYVPTSLSGTYSFGVGGYTIFTFNSPTLGYDIFYGTNPKAVLAKYNAEAGPSRMPPDWAFSSIWWRDDAHQTTGTPATTPLQITELDADALQANHIPAGSMWFDRPYGTGADSTNVSGWGNMDFDSTYQPINDMAAYLDGKGMRMMAWVANKADNTLLTQGNLNHYLFTGYTANPAADLRIPAAYSWMKSSLDNLLSYATLPDGSPAIKGYKIDRGGEGEQPETAINQDVQLMAKLTYEGLQARNGNNFFTFSRSANDTSRMYTAVWNGDSDSTFTGLATSIKNGLRAGLVDFPMWGSDTGGYNSSVTEEVFSRWAGFSAYSPIMEVLQDPSRNVFYNFSSSTVGILATYAQTHQDLIPYTRSSVEQSITTGAPVMRALVLEFPTDVNVPNTWNEYMYGSNLLVAPVITASATSRTVYLPAGNKWIDYNNRSTVYAGGQTVTMSAPIATTPVLAREGSIIPRGDIVQVNNNWTPGWTPSLRLEVFPTTRFTSTFSYWTGSASQTITSAPISGGFDVSFGDLGLNGELDMYVGQPTSVVVNGQTLDPSAWTYDTAHKLLKVSFTGGAANDIQVLGGTMLF